MDTNIWNILVQAIITIATSAFVVKILKQQIKSQQEQINSMKVNIDSMKLYIEILDIKKIKEYVALSEESFQMKTEMKFFKHYNEQIVSQLQLFDEKIFNLNSEHKDKEIKHLETEIELRKLYNELFHFVTLISIFFPKDILESSLKKIFPENADKLIDQIHSLNPKQIEDIEQNMQIYLNKAMSLHIRNI